MDKKFMLIGLILAVLILPSLVFSLLSDETIYLFSPTNSTYTTNQIWINWSYNKTSDWCAFSLNGTQNDTSICIQTKLNTSQVAYNWSATEITNNSTLIYFSIPKFSNITNFYLTLNASPYGQNKKDIPFNSTAVKRATPKFNAFDSVLLWEMGDDAVADGSCSTPLSSGCYVDASIDDGFYAHMGASGGPAEICHVFYIDFNWTQEHITNLTTRWNGKTSMDGSARYYGGNFTIWNWRTSSWWTIAVWVVDDSEVDFTYTWFDQINISSYIKPIGTYGNNEVITRACSEASSSAGETIEIDTDFFGVWVNTTESYPKNVTIDVGNDNYNDTYDNVIKTIKIYDLNITPIQNFVASCIPDNLMYCNFTVNITINDTGYLDMSNISIKFHANITYNFSWGEMHNISIYVNDTTGAVINSGLVYFTVQNPNIRDIQFITPTFANYSTTPNSTIYINASINSSLTSACIALICNLTGCINQSMQIETGAIGGLDSCHLSFPQKSDGNISFQVWANNTLNQANLSGIINVSVYRTLPRIVLNTPNNDTNLTAAWYMLNFTVNTSFLDKVFFQNSTSNTTITNLTCPNSDLCWAYINTTSWSNGSQIIRLWVNSTSANSTYNVMNFTLYRFYQDMDVPFWWSISPNVGGSTLYTGTTQIHTFTGNFNDTFDNTTMIVTISFAGTNYTAAITSGNTFSKSLTSIGVGSYSFYWCATDKAQNINCTDTYSYSVYTTGGGGSSGGGGGGAPSLYCGDGICSSGKGETNYTCPQDCKTLTIQGLPYTIGDGICDTGKGETLAISPDCQTPIDLSSNRIAAISLVIIILGGVYLLLIDRKNKKGRRSRDPRIVS